VAPASAVGGTTYTVTWTVQNRGTAAADPGGLGRPAFIVGPPPTRSTATPNALYLGQVKHPLPLAIDETYTESLTVQLSPSATAKYVVVIGRRCRQ